MFTINKSTFVSEGKNLIEASCKSTDEKPTAGFANGSLVLEMDTGAIYAFDEEAGQWIVVVEGSSSESE